MTPERLEDMESVGKTLTTSYQEKEDWDMEAIGKDLLEACAEIRRLRNLCRQLGRMRNPKLNASDELDALF